MRKTIITCDVHGCNEEGIKVVKSCTGWMYADDYKEYKKMEKPLEAEEVDLCKKHWLEWCKATIKVMKMDKEDLGNKEK